MISSQNPTHEDSEWEIVRGDMIFKKKIKQFHHTKWEEYLTHYFNHKLTTIKIWNCVKVFAECSIWNLIIVLEKKHLFRGNGNVPRWRRGRLKVILKFLRMWKEGWWIDQILEEIRSKIFKISEQAEPKTKPNIPDSTSWLSEGPAMGGGGATSRDSTQTQIPQNLKQTWSKTNFVHSKHPIKFAHMCLDEHSFRGTPKHASPWSMEASISVLVLTSLRIGPIPFDGLGSLSQSEIVGWWQGRPSWPCTCHVLFFLQTKLFFF